MGWFWKRRGKRIKNLVRELPPMLKRDYGHKGPYTRGQIRAATRRYGLSHQEAILAYAMFDQPGSLDSSEIEGVDLRDIEDARAELAETCFGGNQDFDLGDVWAGADGTDYPDAGADVTHLGGDFDF